VSVIREEMVTTALIALLAAQTGVPVGDHSTEDTNGTPIDTSGMYLVVHRIDGGAVDGSFGDPHQDVTLVYQVDSHGRSRPQAEGLARKVTGIMTDMAAGGGHEHTLTGSGWAAGLRTRQTTGRPENEGVDADLLPLWTQRERFEVTVHRA
jgi:hypothetical protein